MKIIHVVGARPNFMKVAPIMREMSKAPKIFKQFLVHTGQHYDESMSGVFFNEIGLPKPDINLNIGSGTHAWQTAQIMIRLERMLQNYSPDWVFVVGDVNSTLAAALVCSKLDIKVAHVEAGLRSFDRSMPEEINRILTDQISDILFTTCDEANKNLLREGIRSEKISFVGNVMIDCLVYLLPKAKKRWHVIHQNLKIKEYILVTLHRPSNVDNPDTLEEAMTALSLISKEIPVVFPLHPRTRKQMIDVKKWQAKNSQLHLLKPMGYLDFLSLEMHARMVLTDSGGVQEETSYLGIPCLTIRPNTERRVTIIHGTNQLVENNCEAIIGSIKNILNIKHKISNKKMLPFWDGKAAGRIVKIMKELA